MASPSSSPTSSLTVSDEHHEHTTLYESLDAVIKHPSCVCNEWIDTIADYKTNPRLLNTPPYNDGSFHWVDNNDDLLCMAFPAVLDIDGKYSKIGPYFNLLRDRSGKASQIFLS
jgi:hypothetical protein